LIQSNEELEEIALKKISEYNFNMEGVKEILKGHNVVFIDANKDQPIVLENIARVLKFKQSQKAPKRAPRIIMIGPPGSGRST
jgi:adenylate kinase